MPIKTPVSVNERGPHDWLVDADGHELCLEDIADIVNAHAALVDVLGVLAHIADEYDRNALDDEARKCWGYHPEQIELYTGRGGSRLLTLADCLKARAVLAACGVPI